MLNKKDRIFNNLYGLKGNGLKTAFTSPDLLGRHEDIELYAKELLNLKYIPDIICCKENNIDLWRSFLNLN